MFKYKICLKLNWLGVWGVFGLWWNLRNEGQVNVSHHKRMYPLIMTWVSHPLWQLECGKLFNSNEPSFQIQLNISLAFFWEWHGTVLGKWSPFNSAGLCLCSYPPHPGQCWQLLQESCPSTQIPGPNCSSSAYEYRLPFSKEGLKAVAVAWH